MFVVKYVSEDVEKVDDVAGNVAAISEEQAASTQEILQTSDDTGTVLLSHF